MFKSQLLKVCSNAARTGQYRQMQQKAERSINQVTLLGRVGRDVEVKGSAEHPMATFSLATGENIKSKDPDRPGEYYQKTSWHRVCVFKPGLVDAVYTYVKKGDRLHVTGRLDYSEYTNTDGIKIQQTNIVADDVIFLKGSETRRDDF